MDMSTIFDLLDEFQARFESRFRYVAGKWWVYANGYWTTHDARQQMSKLLVAVAEDRWPEGHSARRQVTKEYMITRLCAGLVPRLRSDRLPGRAEGVLPLGSQ
jgi:hypothetical protein